MLTGVILVGEEGCLTGGNKNALLPFGDELLIQRQIRLLEPVCAEMIIVTNEPKLLLPVVDRSVRIITDFYPGKGVLGSMHAALSLTASESALIVGCDMPLLSPEAAVYLQRRLERDYSYRLDAVIPEVDGALQPLYGVYRRRCAKVIDQVLAEQLGMIDDVLERLTWKRIREAEFAAAGIEADFATRLPGSRNEECRSLTAH